MYAIGDPTSPLGDAPVGPAPVTSLLDSFFGRSDVIRRQRSDIQAAIDRMTRANAENRDEVNKALDPGPAAGAGPDPVMQALLQQLEYTKPSATSIPASSVSRVTMLPGQQGGGGGALVLIVVIIALGIGAYFLLGKKKGGGGHKGGAQKIESDH